MAEARLLNIHGIIDLDQMAGILTRLIDQIDKQNKIISDLREEMSIFVTKKQFLERITNIEALVSNSMQRIDAVQEATTAFVLNKK